MLVKEYSFKTRKNLTERNFEKINSSYIFKIIEEKERILDMMKRPTIDRDDPDDYITQVSICENGVVFRIRENSNDDRNPDEYASVYFFENGEIHFVLESLISYNWGYQYRDDNVIDELDEKIGKEHELLKEKIFIAELYEQTKPKNKLLMELYKNKLKAILEKATLDLEWCRKTKYEVNIEIGCYKLDSNNPLREGFIEKEFNNEKYAVKEGFNILEQNTWVTSPNRPYIITGTAGERWPIKSSNLSAYDVNEEDISFEGITVSTKDPKDQEFLVAKRIPVTETIKVIPKWAFREDGTIDETQIMNANSKNSNVDHDMGDFVVAKHIDGHKEYMELSDEERNTAESAKLYDPRVINGLVMKGTYDHAITKTDIKNKTLKLLK